jgi:hypothetical protein
VAQERLTLRAHYDAQDPRLAGYLREAMLAYPDVGCSDDGPPAGPRCVDQTASALG